MLEKRNLALCVLLIKALKRLLATGLVAFFGVVYSTSALAVGTAADTDINNFATVDFKVGGVDQTAVPSNTTTFKVDQVVDLTVAEADGVDTNVSPAETGAVARFTVTNTGNATQDFNLSVADLTSGSVFGNPDSIQADALTIVIDANGNGVYDAGTDLVQSFIDELSAVSGSNQVYVFVLADIPADAVDDDAANIRLTATAHKAGAAGLGLIEAESNVDDDAGLQIVFSNNTGTADDSYLVGAATLDAVKSSRVVSDPLLQVFPEALAIPGAIVEYTITITNNGGAPATELVISDVIQSDLTFETGGYSSEDVEITKNDGTTVVTCTADTGDGDGDGCGLAGSTLTVSIPTAVDPDGISVLASPTNNVVVIKFQVSIN